MKRILQTIGVLVFALASAGSAHAVPLSSLFNGGTLTVADKLFDQWTLIFADTSDGHIVNTANIDVTPLGPVGPDPLDPGPGLGFNVLNNELAVTGDGLFAYIDLQFSFRVSVLDPSLRIKDNSLRDVNSTLVRTADGTNDLGIYILETIGTAPGLADLGTKDVEFSVLDEVLTSDLTDSASFAPQSEIWVTKNLLVWAQDDTDSATLGGFSQRFSQTTVPEPATSLLLAAALAAVGAARRRA